MAELEEGKRDSADGAENSDDAKDEERMKKKPKKMKVNQEYVKEKVRSQMKKLASKNRNKHNN